jgi:S-adenosylmethionine:diacylglycerol 3-amino-3-carboxypropyl transferase
MKSTYTDEMKWILESSGRYTTRSLHRQLTFGGVKDTFVMKIWKCQIPLKVKFFLWMAFHDRVQSAVQLKKNATSQAQRRVSCVES